MRIPEKYAWLKEEKGPRMIIEGLKLYGIKEIPGKRSNPLILAWAKELWIDSIYNNDDTAWCSLVHAIICKASGKPVKFKGYELLRAKSWLRWGKPVELGEEMLGDTLVFGRKGGFHVGLYVGEDNETFRVLGGNQSNSYNISKISKTRLIGCRRLYKTTPDNIRKIYFDDDDSSISINEV